jgi:dihydrolipoamide dehydrogenase
MVMVAWVIGNDGEVATKFKSLLQSKQGFKFKMSTKVMKAEKTSSGGVKLTLQPAAGGAEEILEADVALVSTGRRPYTIGLGLQEIGITMDGAKVKTDDHFRTNIPSMYLHDMTYIMFTLFSSCR